MSEGNFTIVNNTAKYDGNLLWDIIIACNLFISQKSYNKSEQMALSDAGLHLYCGYL